MALMLADPAPRDASCTAVNKILNPASCTAHVHVLYHFCDPFFSSLSTLPFLAFSLSLSVSVALAVWVAVAMQRCVWVVVLHLKLFTYGQLQQRQQQQCTSLGCV